jgi:hypothetical protein
MLVKCLNALVITNRGGLNTRHQEKKPGCVRSIPNVGTLRAVVTLRTTSGRVGRGAVFAVPSDADATQSVRMVAAGTQLRRDADPRRAYVRSLRSHATDCRHDAQNGRTHGRGR